MAWSHPSTFAWRHSLAGALLVCLSIGNPAAAADETEKERLAAVVRQIDILERLARQAAAVASEESARYHFDYPRLAADLQRVRAGIHDHLTSQRAQPRDPVVLSGDYRQDSDQNSDQEAQP